MATYVDLSADDAEMLAAIDHGGDPGVRGYERRLADWLEAGQSDDQAYRSLFPA